ncbi:polysaccharide pyruvyl transferase family protein [Ruania suaedae]|uniref:polysaccharide pyruvyl transferase family protein n=1 Tax=Ruania suaedae TaxID=2897774 RepID=UPI001E513BAC|nr:polysaccharide pyruvyl transferase family protein [Ruania suaedae]UFU02386.1 polysaccharide pyruvyl transferase family protein [Ruania suaedae]
MTGLRLVLAGAAIGNGNRGVEALGRSVIDAVERDSPHTLLSVLDDGWGVRRDGRRPELLEYVGVRLSRRWHRPESWAQIRLAQALRPRINPVARRFARADAILDLSAGDSFTDLYGPARLAMVCAPKDAALRAGRPLVLLPQTYGPFKTAAGRRRAERIVRSAALAYARDPWSHDRLLELAGRDGDDTRLRSGVDVAFALEPRLPRAEITERIEQVGSEGPLAGVNVSGLLVGAAGHARFGLAGDYLETMVAVVRGLISAGAHVLLVPHVHVPGGRDESDVAALRLVLEHLSERERVRTTLLPPQLDAAELKWSIARCDWFVGSRMHATIAALSTLTPAAAYVYSDKTRGVFDTCGVGDEVVDARRTAGRDAADRMIGSFERRAVTRTVLEDRAPQVVERSRAQLREVLDTVRRWRESPHRAVSAG